VGAIVRAEQAHFLENTKFATSFDELSKLVKADTTNYKYTFVGAKPDTDVVVNGTTNNANALKSYSGAVKVVKVGGAGATKDDATTAATVCETSGPSATPVVPVADGAAAAARCPGGNEVGG
jgi:molybdopterin biosynthesis enzyme MoaB